MSAVDVDEAVDLGVNIDLEVPCGITLFGECGKPAAWRLFQGLHAVLRGVPGPVRDAPGAAAGPAALLGLQGAGHARHDVVRAAMSHNPWRCPHCGLELVVPSLVADHIRKVHRA